MDYSFKEKLKHAFLACLFLIPHTTQAQSSNDMAEVKRLLNDFYSYNKLMMFHCFIPKPGISKEQTTKVLKRYVNSDELEAIPFHTSFSPLNEQVFAAQCCLHVVI